MSGINPRIYIISEDLDYQRADDPDLSHDFSTRWFHVSNAYAFSEGSDYTFSAGNSGRRLIIKAPLDCKLELDIRPNYSIPTRP